MKLIVAMLICTACLLNGQQDTTQPVYQLDVAIHEVEGGKRVETRDYTLLVRNSTKATSRTGTRVPVSMGENIQYVDVGANLDFTLREAGDSVMLNADLELSDAGEVAGGASIPAIRQLRYRVNTMIPVGKKTMIGKLDEPTGSKGYEIEVTASKASQ